MECWISDWSQALLDSIKYAFCCDHGTFEFHKYQGICFQLRACRLLKKESTPRSWLVLEASKRMLRRHRRAAHKLYPYMFTILHTMEARYKIFKFIQKCLVSADSRDKKDKRSWGGWVYVRCLFTFLSETLNVINFFRSYEQRSCPSMFVLVCGLPAGSLPQTDTKWRYGLPRDCLFLFWSTCSIS
jgi:hypothetical protein